MSDLKSGTGWEKNAEYLAHMIWTDRMLRLPFITDSLHSSTEVRKAAVSQ